MVIFFTNIVIILKKIPIFCRYVRTSALSEELIYLNPSSSAHVTFKTYLEDYSGHKKHRRRRRRKSCDLETETEVSVADEMPIVIQLASSDIANIKSSWTTVESMLLQVPTMFRQLL